MRTLFLFILLSLVSFGTQAQLKAKAISYTVEADLAKFNPDAAANISQKICKFEVDAYFTAEMLRTNVRTISVPQEFALTIRQRLYNLKSKDEYNIDHENKFILVKKDQNFKITSTKNQKTILGYACREYTFKDYRNVQYNAWVTDKLPVNICPMGNFSLKGTVLEVTTSNGFHFLATDIAEGELDNNFFALPQGYQEEIVSPPAAQKK